MKSKIRFFTLFAVVLMVTTGAYSQQARTGQSAEATLHVLISGRGPGSAKRMPEGMAAISDQIKRRFNAEDLTLLDTSFSRLAIGGSGEFKSSVRFERGGGTISDAFIDWRLIKLGSAVEQAFDAESFRFTLRAVPTMRPPGDGTKPPGLINYESVSASLIGLSFPENTPQLLGTINMPDGVGKLFLVLAVRNTK